MPLNLTVPFVVPKPPPQWPVTGITFGTVSGMEIGYARVSTVKQDLARQLDALAAAGIETVFSDKKSGATRDRAGLQDALRHVRAGDVIVVHTLDRLGRTVRDTLNLVHELKERGVGVRTLADPLPIDTSNPDSPMAQLAVVLLALFAEMERTYAAERASHARAVASANGRRTGRPSVVDADNLEHAALLRDKGFSMKEITAKTGLKRTTLYRHLPPRSPAGQVTTDASYSGPAEFCPDLWRNVDPGAADVRWATYRRGNSSGPCRDCLAGRLPRAGNGAIIQGG
jgi:DNA invertase Pin-like site-specific DNA recombinase